VLKERFTLAMAVGMVVILAGVALLQMTKAEGEKALADPAAAGRDSRTSPRSASRSKGTSPAS
jgi:hypothetical protein